MTIEDLLAIWQKSAAIWIQFQGADATRRAEFFFRHFKDCFLRAVDASQLDLSTVVEETAKWQQTNYMSDICYDLMQRLLAIAADGQIQNVESSPIVPRSQKGGRFGSAERHNPR
jgi:hypothetical protein